MGERDGGRERLKGGGRGEGRRDGERESGWKRIFPGRKNEGTEGKERGRDAAEGMEEVSYASLGKGMTPTPLRY